MTRARSMQSPVKRSHTALKCRSLLDRLETDSNKHDLAYLAARLAVELCNKNPVEFPEFATRESEAIYKAYLEDTAILAELDRIASAANRKAVLAEMDRSRLTRPLVGAARRVLDEMEHRGAFCLEEAARVVLCGANKPGAKALCWAMRRAARKPIVTEARVEAERTVTMADAAREAHRELRALPWYRRKSATCLEKSYLQRKNGRKGESGHSGNPAHPGSTEEVLRRETTLTLKQARRKDGSPATKTDGLPLMVWRLTDIGDVSEAYLQRIASEMRALLAR